MEFAGERDSRQLVITPDVQYTGSRAVSEILTLYALQIDAKDYQGEGGSPIPYRERYSYRNLTPEDLSDPPADTVWVQKAAALPPELPSGWELYTVGDYAVLWVKGG